MCLTACKHVKRNMRLTTCKHVNVSLTADQHGIETAASNHKQQWQCHSNACRSNNSIDCTHG